MGKESAYTSLNQIPAGFKKFEFGHTNLDWGGGKYDKATDYLMNLGTRNVVLDQYNRSSMHNTGTMVIVTNRLVETITLFNVLNVIQCKIERKHLLKSIRRVCDYQRKNFKQSTVVIIQIYEGSKSGKPSKKTVQNNMKTAAYIPEIQAVFPEWEVQRQGNFLIV